MHFSGSFSSSDLCLCRNSFKNKSRVNKTTSDEGEGRDAFEEEKQENERKKVMFGVSDDENEEEDEEEKVIIYFRTQIFGNNALLLPLFLAPFFTLQLH